MKKNKFYTILLNFSDHLVGIEQYYDENPEKALKKFVNLSESLEGYDRHLLSKSLLPLIDYVDIKGVWSFTFNPDIDWSHDNPPLGGQIIQTDSSSTIRKIKK
jgi:hypothetical protein